MGTESDRKTIETESPRPLADAVKKLQKLSIIPIHYEDTRYEQDADLENATEKVLTPEQKKMRNSSNRIIVPRRGKISFSIKVDPVTQGLENEDQAYEAAQQAVNAWNTSEGTFQVLRTRLAIHIVPMTLRDKTGKVRTIDPVFNQPISFPLRSRTIFDTLNLIYQQVSAASGYKIVPGNGLLQGIFTNTVVLQANGEPAREILDQLFYEMRSMKSKQLNRTSDLQYLMFFDPRVKGYAVNIARIP